MAGIRSLDTRVYGLEKGINAGLWFRFDLDLEKVEAELTQAALAAAILAALGLVPPPANLVIAKLIADQRDQLVAHMGPNGVSVHVEVTAATAVPAIEFHNWLSR